MVECVRFSARFAPVKYLFSRKGLVRVSVEKPENEPIEICVENVLEVALPFVDDFSQNPGLGDTIELEVYLLFLHQVLAHYPLPCIVHLQTRKFREADLRAHLATKTR